MTTAPGTTSQLSIASSSSSALTISSLPTILPSSSSGTLVTSGLIATSSKITSQTSVESSSSSTLAISGLPTILPSSSSSTLITSDLITTSAGATSQISVSSSTSLTLTISSFPNILTSSSSTTLITPDLITTSTGAASQTSIFSISSTLLISSIPSILPSLSSSTLITSDLIVTSAGSTSQTSVSSISVTSVSASKSASGSESTRSEDSTSSLSVQYPSVVSQTGSTTSTLSLLNGLLGSGSRSDSTSSLTTMGTSSTLETSGGNAATAGLSLGSKSSDGGPTSTSNPSSLQGAMSTGLISSGSTSDVGSSSPKDSTSSVISSTNIESNTGSSSLERVSENSPTMVTGTLVGSGSSDSRSETTSTTGAGTSLSGISSAFPASSGQPGAGTLLSGISSQSSANSGQAGAETSFSGISSEFSSSSGQAVAETSQSGVRSESSTISGQTASETSSANYDTSSPWRTSSTSSSDSDGVFRSSTYSSSAATLTLPGNGATLSPETDTSTFQVSSETSSAKYDISSPQSTLPTWSSNSGGAFRSSTYSSSAVTLTLPGNSATLSPATDTYTFGVSSESSSQASSSAGRTTFGTDTSHGQVMPSGGSSASIAQSSAEKFSNEASDGSKSTGISITTGVSTSTEISTRTGSSTPTRVSTPTGISISAGISTSTGISISRDLGVLSTSSESRSYSSVTGGPTLSSDLASGPQQGAPSAADTSRSDLPPQALPGVSGSQSSSLSQQMSFQSASVSLTGLSLSDTRSASHLSSDTSQDQVSMSGTTSKSDMHSSQSRTLESGATNNPETSQFSITNNSDLVSGLGTGGLGTALSQTMPGSMSGSLSLTLNYSSASPEQQKTSTVLEPTSVEFRPTTGPNVDVSVTSILNSGSQDMSTSGISGVFGSGVSPTGLGVSQTPWLGGLGTNGQIGSGDASSSSLTTVSGAPSQGGLSSQVSLGTVTTSSSAVRGGALGSTTNSAIPFSPLSRTTQPGISGSGTFGGPSSPSISNDNVASIASIGSTGAAGLTPSATSLGPEPSLAISPTSMNSAQFGQTTTNFAFGSSKSSYLGTVDENNPESSDLGSHHPDPSSGISSGSSGQQSRTGIETNAVHISGSNSWESAISIGASATASDVNVVSPNSGSATALPATPNATFGSGQVSGTQDTSFRSGASTITQRTKSSNTDPSQSNGGSLPGQPGTSVTFEGRDSSSGSGRSSGSRLSTMHDGSKADTISHGLTTSRAISGVPSHQIGSSLTTNRYSGNTGTEDFNMSSKSTTTMPGQQPSLSPSNVSDETASTDTGTLSRISRPSVSDISPGYNFQLTSGSAVTLEPVPPMPSRSTITLQSPGSAIPGSGTPMNKTQTSTLKPGSLPTVLLPTTFTDISQRSDTSSATAGLNLSSNPSRGSFSGDISSFSVFSSNADESGSPATNLSRTSWLQSSSLMTSTRATPSSTDRRLITSEGTVKVSVVVSYTSIITVSLSSDIMGSSMQAGNNSVLTPQDTSPGPSISSTGVGNISTTAGATQSTESILEPRSSRISGSSRTGGSMTEPASMLDASRLTSETQQDTGSSEAQTSSKSWSSSPSSTTSWSCSITLMLYLVRETSTVPWGIAQTTVTVTDAGEPTSSWGCLAVISTIALDRSTKLAAGETATVVLRAVPSG